MADTNLQRVARARARDVRRSIGEQLLSLRTSRGLSLREVAREARIDRAVLARAEAGEGELASSALAPVAACLGAEASVRLYPTTGPRLVDHTQARMIDALAAVLHSRWHLRLEVPVWRPVRGVIDLVLEESADRTVVAGEAHGQLRSVEQQLRWAGEKADALGALPETDGHRLCRLLLLRNTADLRATISAVPALFKAAYPESTAEAVAALTKGAGAFPAAAICWVDIRGSSSRLLAGPPRGISLGR